MLMADLARTFRDGLAGPRWRDAAGLAEHTGLVLDPWQQDVVTSDAPEQLWLCARQTGKSSTAALRAVHTAASAPGSLTLIGAPAMRQAGELFAKVKGTLSALGPRGPGIRRESLLALTLVSGSRIVVIPGDETTARGYSDVRLLVLDEAARIPEAVYHALRPMLAISHGTLLGLSTPAGTRGWFHREWTEGGPGWHRVTVTADQCPRLSPAWLTRERERIGPWWYAQEYECRFLDADDAVFSTASIHAAVRPEVAPLRLFSAA